MSNLPSGTVTFLFTDIEGSTKLSQQHPDAMPVLLARHNQILHQAIEAQNGYVFQIVGDSFSAAFHSASDSLNAALNAQRVLQNESWIPTPIKVRMGIHTGTAQLNDDNQYSGYATLAFTQRIMSAGHGGQILLSGATRELVRDGLPTNTELSDLGEKRLKDLLRPEHLYQLNILGLPTVFPPLKTLDSFPNNLPPQLTSFIGRENEIAEVKQELESHRLVTLTGSGGTGKTRLSLQVAADLLEKFDHGVWFIELAPLTDPDLIPQTILSDIGISEQPNKTPLEILKEYLHEKKILIMLDNCEHLVTASAQVVNTLLNAAPNLKVLASSREALGVKGEASYPVPSLSLPDIKHLPAIEGLSQYEAVRLFIDRALLVAPHFVVDKDNAPFIAQICYRLDGIPLAIELAAARIKILSVEQISKRLDDRFRLLTGGARTALPRQQTLRALIDWSYDILSEDERLLLHRLSVFAGGWALEAVEEVCSGDGIETHDVLDLLTQLVNKSLVVVMEHSQSGETRYRMLETIRQYAREKLLEVGGGDSIRDKHLAYFVQLTEQAKPELHRTNQAFWLNKLDDELDNLRVSLQWASAGDGADGLRISTNTARFWFLRSISNELNNWLVQLLQRYDKADRLRAKALTIRSNCVVNDGNLDEARLLAEQSLKLARTLNDKKAEASSLLNLGQVTKVQGNTELANELVQESLTLYQDLKDTIGQANTIGWLINNNDMERSRTFARDALKLYRELGDLDRVAWCLTTLAGQTIWEGDFSSYVRDWLEEAQMIYDQLGSKSGKSTTLQLFGRLAFWRGDYEEARIFWEESIALSEQTGSSLNESWSRVNLAYVVLRQGDILQAKDIFSFSIQQFHKVNNMIGIVYTIEGLASLDVNRGQPERAMQLFTWADAMRDKIGEHRPPVEQNSVEKDLAVIRSKVSDEEFAKFSEEGRLLTTEQAIALALAETSS
jgi:predicted ATPase/class 3 adenylate cyclase